MSDNFAQAIRRIISPSLSDDEVECVTVILVSHLMIEEKINVLIYKWLTNHLPTMGIRNRCGTSVNDIAREELGQYIEKLDFIKKLNLIKPLGTLLWSDDSKDIFKDIHKINDARVEIAHRLDITKIKFDGLSLATKDGVEKFIDLSQQRLLNIDTLIELIAG